MTSLQHYIHTTGQSQTALAAEIGIGRAYMSQLVNGQRTPSLALAVRINEITGGQVPVTGWKP